MSSGGGDCSLNRYISQCNAAWVVEANPVHALLDGAAYVTGWQQFSAAYIIRYEWAITTTQLTEAAQAIATNRVVWVATFELLGSHLVDIVTLLSCPGFFTRL